LVIENAVVATDVGACTVEFETTAIEWSLCLPATIANESSDVSCQC